jgi:RHS repeat-associated protein
VYYKLLGTAPKRQLWIKWVSFKMGTGIGTACSGATIPDNLCWAIVLEESTNKIYVVDMYRGSNYTNSSASIGLQFSTSSGVSYSSNAQFQAQQPVTYTDNYYYSFIPTESSSSLSTLTFTATDLTSSANQSITIPQAYLLDKTLNNSTLYVDFNTGDDNNCGLTPYTASVKVKAEALNSSGTVIETIFTDKTFSLSETTPEQLKVDDITTNYSGFAAIKITVSNYTPPSLACSSNVKLTAWIEEDYDANVNTDPYDESPFVRLTATSNSVNPISFNWSSDCRYLSKYQLQILRLYNIRETYNDDVRKVYCTVDWGKATNIELSGSATNLSLNLFEGTGYYAWRIRPIGDYYEGEIANSLNWGTWTDHASGGANKDASQDAIINITSSASLPSYLFYFRQAEYDKVWQASRVYTENTGITEGMTFYDGLFRPRQSQHHLQSESKFLVSQSLYDFSGRNVLNTMAAPLSSSSSTFDYKENLLTYGGSLYTASNFDAEDNYDNPDIVNGGAITQYYSDNTTYQPDTKIPSADGYPFSRSLFMEDGTNRPREVGGPGNTFRIGGGSSDGGTTTSRTSKIYFSSVTNHELIKMFGSEAPVESTVYTVITVDPNKTTSRGFMTLDGKTIATCQSGNAGAPLQALDYESETIYDTIRGDCQLNENTFCKEHSLLVLEGSLSPNISYSLSPSEIQQECASTYCTSCDYYVSVYIKNIETGENVWEQTQLIEPSGCGSTVAAWEFNSADLPADEQPSLDLGSYVVGRCISTNNINENSETQESYQSEILSATGDLINSDINDSWAAFKTSYNNGEITTPTQLYDYLATNFGIEDIYNQTEISMPAVSGSDCHNVTIPVEICHTPCEDGTPDFEAMLIDTWGEQGYGYYLYDYFYNFTSFHEAMNGGHFYPHNTSQSTNYILFSDGDNTVNECRITLTIGDRTILSNVQIGYGTDKGNSLASNAVTMINFMANPYYEAEIDANQAEKIILYSNVDEGGEISPYMVINTDPLSTGSSHYGAMGMQEFSPVIDDATMEIGSNGSFNEMINQMIDEDGYYCDTLVRIWEAVVQAYPTLQYVNGDRSQGIKNFDLMDYFLSQAGCRYEAVSTNLTTTENDEGLPLYTNAYKVFYKEEASAAESVYEDCKDYYGFDYDANLIQGYLAEGPDNRFEDSDTKYWGKFKKCLLSSYSFEANSTDSDNPVSILSDTLLCASSDYTCANALVEAQEDTCIEVCRLRFHEFFGEAQRMLELNGSTTYTEEDLWCLATAMQESCEQDCELTLPFTLADDGITRIPGEISRLQQQNVMHVMTYDIDIQPSTCTSCGTEYDRLEVNNKYFTEALLDELNNRLVAFVNAGATTINFVAINEWVSEIYEYANYDNIDPECRMPELTSGSYPINRRSAFSILISGGQKYIYLNNSSRLTNIPANCDFIISCIVYFRWVEPSITPQDSITIKTCEDETLDYLISLIDVQLSEAYAEKLADMKWQYKTTCMNPKAIVDELTLSYEQGYHHYTLFYYDRAGELIKTVPPKGVSDNVNFPFSSRAEVPDYDYATTYIYDSFNRLSKKTTPDGGSNYYYYNSLGQLRCSQTARQAADGKFSYIKFDELGRPIEAGQSNYNTDHISELAYLDDADFPNGGTEEQKTFTVYSSENSSAVYISTGETQEYILNRISYAYSDADGIASSGDEVYTYFSYDPHGNAEWLIQDIPGIGKQYIKFEYDLVSNKVNKVIYNEGRKDQLQHRYTYDSDNRVIEVETSTNGIIWDSDAHYEYYAHGPLKRIELGEDKIQGLDYVYTLQGWLKGINHPGMSTSNDPGQDNLSSADNADFAKDAFGMMLSYYNGDFNRSSSVFNDATALASSYSISAEEGYGSLYNGMIAGQMWNNSLSSSAARFYKAGSALSAIYTYDDLGRYVGQTLGYFGSSIWNEFSGNDYAEAVSYDDNGNITLYSRNGYGMATSTTYNANQVSMDDLAYTYTGSTNQLNFITDAYSTPTSYGTDLESQSANNYTYDLSGNLTSDSLEGISSFSWTPSGKVNTVTKSDYTLSYLYDALGNRVKKTNTTNSGSEQYTYYVYNPMGQLMSIYEASGTATAAVTEAPVYGANRIGAYESGQNVNTLFSAPIDNIYTRHTSNGMNALKKYELGDHLGNVRVLVNDAKTVNGSTYSANIISAVDYYPFGMEMPGRSYHDENTSIGYQGKLKDNDIKSNGNSYDFGARLLDPRVGRWLSVDPMEENFADKSPYNSMNNDPNAFMDPTGEVPIAPLIVPAAATYKAGQALSDGDSPSVAAGEALSVTDVDDAAVLMTGMHTNGEDATMSDYGWAVVGACIPVASGALLSKALKSARKAETAADIAKVVTKGSQADILLEGAKLLVSKGNLSTGGKKIVLWSGMSAEAAEKWAKENNSFTLGMTEVGKKLAEMDAQLEKLGVPWEVRRDIWKQASERFVRENIKDGQLVKAITGTEPGNLKTTIVLLDEATEVKKAGGSVVIQKVE